MLFIFLIGLCHDTQPSEILGLIPVFVVGHIVDSYCLGFDRGVIHIVVFCHIVNDHYLK